MQASTEKGPAEHGLARRRPAKVLLIQAVNALQLKAPPRDDLVHAERMLAHT